VFAQGISARRAPGRAATGTEDKGMTDTNNSMSRKERERMAHRRAILQTAEEVFAQKGFHSATVQEIAERSEFSVGYLYKHFENKQALYVELVDRRLTDYMDHVEGRLNAVEDNIHKIGVAIRAVLEYFMRHEQFFRIFIRVGSQTGDELTPGLPEKTVQKYYDYTRRLAEMMKRGVDMGIIIEADPELLVSCLEEMTHAAMRYCLVNDVPADGPMAALLEDIFLHGIAGDAACNEESA
jgi:AcrR family transcriptional regulator